MLLADSKLFMQDVQALLGVRPNPARVIFGVCTVGLIFFMMIGCGYNSPTPGSDDQDRATKRQDKPESKPKREAERNADRKAKAKAEGTEKATASKPKRSIGNSRPEPATEQDRKQKSQHDAPAKGPADNAGKGNARHDASVKVARVVDGDTIEISPPIGGVSDVRLIGLDTPETVDPGEPVEPLGPRSSVFAKEKLLGQRIGLEFDVERTDQYDRLLAYVYLENRMFNEVLVRGGYAQAYPYPPNTRHQELFAAAQRSARAAEIGIWGLSRSKQCQLANRGNGIGEGTPGCSGQRPSRPKADPAPTPRLSRGGGNRGGGMPPLPADRDYDCTHFDTRAQAQRVYERDTSDPYRLDGSPEDGVACESLP